MPVNLQKRHLLKLTDYTREEILFLLDLSHALKRAKKAGVEKKQLAGKNIVLIFEKTSTRTRCAFEVAAYDLGMNVTYLDVSGSQMGKKESMEDTARVLGRYYDGIEFRGFQQKTVELIAAHAGVPVWNGLTNEYHPTQVLADFMTIQEKFDKPLEEVALAYIGDGRNNMASSLLTDCALMGMDIRIIAPETLLPRREICLEANKLAEASGGKVRVTTDIKEGVKGAHVIYTDVWVSMGDEAFFEERVKLLQPYQVDMGVLAETGIRDVIFMHCLPAFHDTNTVVGSDIYQKYGLREMEVTDEVFRSRHAVVFDEAENRLHTIKAVMVATLGS